MSARNDSAEPAARMLDHLEQAGRRRLVREAVTIVTIPPTRKDIDLPAIEQHFAARTRAVLLAPYEKLIDSGEPIRYGELSGNTKDAWLKIAVYTPAGAVKYFESLGVPGFFAYLTMAAEIGGGTLLLLGIGTRWVALALIPLILGTIYLVHGKNGWLFSNKDGGWEYPAFWAVVLAALALLGDGTAALGPMIRLN